MVKVMVFGTFDILHEGHIDFLRQAKMQGELIVSVGTDGNVEKFKGKRPLHSLKKRMDAIVALGIAKLVVAGHDSDFYSSIRDHQPDIICLGYDQDSLGVEEFTRKNKLKIKVIRLQPYRENEYKSSILRKKQNA